MLPDCRIHNLPSNSKVQSNNLGQTPGTFFGCNSDHCKATSCFWGFLCQENTRSKMRLPPRYLQRHTSQQYSFKKVNVNRHSCHKHNALYILKCASFFIHFQNYYCKYFPDPLCEKLYCQILASITFFNFCNLRWRALTYNLAAFFALKKPEKSGFFSINLLLFMMSILF